MEKTKTKNKGERFEGVGGENQLTANPGRGDISIHLD